MIIRIQALAAFSILAFMVPNAMAQNVGVNVNPPLQKLDVAGGIRLNSNAAALAGSIRFSGGQFEVCVTDGVWVPLASMGPTGPTGADGADGATGPTGATGPLVGGTVNQTLRHDGTEWQANSLLVNDGANVGIGVTSPVNVLHIHEHDAVNNPEGLRVTHATYGATATDGIFLGLANSGEAYLWNHENSPLLIATDDQERMRVTSMGRVGIGTGSPEVNLHIQDNTGTHPTIRLSTTALNHGGQLRLATGVNPVFSISNSESSGSIEIDHAAGNKVTLAGDGDIDVSLPSSATLNVGVDISLGEDGLATARSLRLSQGAATDHVLKSTDNNGNAAWVDISTLVQGDDLGDHTATQSLMLNGNWLSNSGGAYGIRIADLGNVGLGETTPLERLHVEGNVLLSRGADRVLRVETALAPSNHNTPAGNSLTVLAGHSGTVGDAFAQRGGDLVLQAGSGYTNTIANAHGGDVVIRSGSNLRATSSAKAGGDIILQTGGVNNTFTERMRFSDTGVLTLPTLAHPTENRLLTISAATGQVTLSNIIPSTVGTVSSVGLTMPAGFSVGSSPVTTSGTLAVTTTLNGPIKGNGSGFTAGAINLASSEVTGLLPIANGGTNSGTALNNNRVMVSSGGAIRENAALGASSGLYTDGNGLPTTLPPNNGNIGYWTRDNANGRLYNTTLTDNVGIGTAAPDRPLTVVSNSEWNIASRSQNNTSTNRNHLLLQRANGNAAVTADFNLGGIAMAGYDGTNYGLGWNGGAEITAHASQTWTSSARGTYLTLSTTADNTASISERLRITSGGNVGIATVSPRTVLNVSGGIGIGSGNGLSDVHGARNTIQINSDTYYGGTHDEHSGFLMYSTMPGGWGTSRLHFAGSTNWGTYDTGTPAMTVSNNGIFGKFRHVTYHGYNDGNFRNSNETSWFPSAGAEGQDDRIISGTTSPGNDRSRCWVAPYNGRLVKVVVRVGDNSGSDPELRARVIMDRNGTAIISSGAVNVHDNSSGSLTVDNNFTFSAGDRLAVGWYINDHAACVGGDCRAEDTQYWVALIWEYNIQD